MTSKEFKCVTSSSNTDGFGLAGHIVIARDGHALEVGQHRFSTVKEMQKGDIVVAQVDSNGRCHFDFQTYGETTVNELNPAPRNVARKVWAKAK